MNYHKPYSLRLLSGMLMMISFDELITKPLHKWLSIPEFCFKMKNTFSYSNVDEAIKCWYEIFVKRKDRIHKDAPISGQNKCARLGYQGSYETNLGG